MAALEWLEPPFAAGHWTPQLIDFAGGEDVLGFAGEKSEEQSWELIAASCGFVARGRESTSAATIAFIGSLCRITHNDLLVLGFSPRNVSKQMIGEQVDHYVALLVQVVSGASVSATILSGGELLVSSGAAASSATVSSGGMLLARAAPPSSRRTS